MKAHELARELLKLPPETPVVIAQDNEPVAHTYGVAGVEIRRMRCDAAWSDPKTWEYASVHRPHDNDVDVCLIDFNEPVRQVVDGDVVDAEVLELHEQATTPCPSCGNPLNVSIHTRPGDQVACSRCQQIVAIPQGAVLTVAQLDGGPGWRALAGGVPRPHGFVDLAVAEHAAAIDGYDRDTRILAVADDAHTSIDQPVTMPVALARLDQALAVSRCYVCNQPVDDDDTALCGSCAKVVDAR